MKECEICRNKFKLLDKHHIQSKSKGGCNKPWNIAHICPNCHRAVHLGEIILEGKFNSTDGMILFFHTEKDDFVVSENPPEVYLIKR